MQTKLNHHIWTHCHHLRIVLCWVCYSCSCFCYCCYYHSIIHVNQNIVDTKAITQAKIMIIIIVHNQFNHPNCINSTESSSFVSLLSLRRNHAGTCCGQNHVTITVFAKQKKQITHCITELDYL